MSAGVLYGLGVGPGDPELVTLKAARIARACPVLAYPAPEQGESQARAIMAPHLPGGQIEVAIRMALDPARFPANDVYDEAAATLGRHLDGGRDVAVLCLGDPFLYGSFMYLFARMSPRYRTVVVPGVSSILAAAAALGQPLAARDDSLAVIPATLPEARIESLLRECEAAAFVKLGRHIDKVRRVIDRAGLMAQARYIENVGRAGERAALLSAIDTPRAPYFSLVLVHRRGAAWR